jgi:hypothetical protein
VKVNLRGSTLQLVLGAALAALMWSASAQAQTETERARAHFQTGVELLDAREFARALGEFRAAYALWKNPKILLNIGTCLRELGRDAEAANAYARYLRDPEADAGRRAEVSSALREIDEAVSRLDIRVNAPDARVLVDGGDTAEWHRDEPLRVAPGTHTVIADKIGLSPAVSTVAVARGETRVVELVLSESDAAPGEPPTARDQAGRAPSTPERDEAPVPRDESLSHAYQPGVFLRVDIDGEGRGAVVVPGVSFGIGDHIEAAAAGLIGRDKGVWIGGRLFALSGALKPSLLLGSPIFSVGGARVGLQAAAGLVWDPSRHLGVSVDLGIVHFPSPPSGYDATVLLPSVGLQTRL